MAVSVYAAGEVLVEAARQHLEDNESVFTGDLYDSIGVRAVPAPYGSVSVEVATEDIDYAMAVETGKPPRLEDYERMYAWAQHKQIIPSSGTYGQMINRMIAVIAKRGSKPHPFMQPAWEEGRGIAADVFYKKMRQQVRSVLR